MATVVIAMEKMWKMFGGKPQRRKMMTKRQSCLDVSVTVLDSTVTRQITSTVSKTAHSPRPHTTALSSSSTLSRTIEHASTTTLLRMRIFKHAPIFHTTTYVLYHTVPLPKTLAHAPFSLQQIIIFHNTALGIRSRIHKYFIIFVRIRIRILQSTRKKNKKTLFSN
jgi:hypothetical protein